MVASAPIANVASNKYIVLFQGTYAISDNKYNYKKIEPQIIPNF